MGRPEMDHRYRTDAYSVGRYSTYNLLYLATARGEGKRGIGLMMG